MRVAPKFIISNFPIATMPQPIQKNQNSKLFYRQRRLKRSFIPSMSNDSEKRSVWSSGFDFAVAMT